VLEDLPMGTRHYPLLEHRRLIAAWRTSGLSARAFAVQRGIMPETFRRWFGEAGGNATGRHAYRRPILDVGVCAAHTEVCLSLEKLKT
jgi:hypothetical protein